MENWTKTSIFANETDGVLGTIAHEWVSSGSGERYMAIRLNGDVEIHVNRATADHLSVMFSRAADMLAPDPWADDATDLMGAFLGILPPFPTIRD